MRAIASLGCEGAMRAIAPSMSPHVSPPSRAPHRYSVPQPQAAEQPFKQSAPPRRHCQRPQLVTPQGSRVTVQIEQYLLCSAAQLTCCLYVVLLLLLQRRGSFQAFCQASAFCATGASRMLTLASTTPRSYGRRHRSWHCEPQAQASCCNLRRQHREATAAGNRS